MELRGAAIVLECLREENVDTVFGYPGGAAIPLYDALYDYEDSIRHILTAHEQGAVHAADGYSRSTGKVGVCFSTSGPGATNCVTGIATAYADSIPLVIITGQVSLNQLGRDSFQEVDITSITLSITKHNFQVKSINDLAKTVREAFEIAKSGRPGPVLVDISKDILVSKGEYELPLVEAKVESDHNTNENDIKQIAQLINEAKYPVIYQGGGIRNSNASEELTRFAEKGNIPIVSTLMGLGGISRSHPLSLGLVGMHGLKASNLAVQNCDLLIAVGSRFSDRATGKAEDFSPKAKIIQLDIDISEISKNKLVDSYLVGDLKESLTKLYRQIDSKERTSWLSRINRWSEEEDLIPSDWDGVKVIEIANEVFNMNNTIVATDVGQHQMFVAQYWKMRSTRNFITSGGLGTMGFGLGAAIGSQIGNPKKKVVLVTGDGSFRMNCNEMATVSRYNLPITILLFNNNTLGMVRQWQDLFFNQRFSQTDLGDEVDYIKLGEAYGFKCSRVDNVDDLRDALEEANQGNTRTLIECKLSKNDMVFPIVPSGMSIDNMIFY